jgi:HD-GYP domain-containing protein (c-di-GMP phosphodiesterase class II)
MTSRHRSAALSGRGGRLTGTLGRRGLAVLALVLVAPTALMAGLRAFPHLDVLFESVTFHLIVVSAIAGCALVVAMLTAVTAARSRQPAMVLLACGCVAVGVLLLGHGLTTPGVWSRPFNPWVGRFPVLAMAAFAACLGAALGHGSSFVLRTIARWPRVFLGAVVAVLVGGSAIITARPDTVLASPLPAEETVTHAVLIVSALVLLLTGAVHWRRWRLGRDRVELALVLACWLSVDAIVAFEVGPLWRVSWWDYHAYLLTGFGSAAWAVLAGYRRTRSAETALASISVRDPMEHITRGYPEALHALVGEVEAKDRYTHGHSARVADLSTKIGLHMGLDPDTLRGLSQGAILHDIGKLTVPDHVLNKPGSLSDEEWVWVRSHPVSGWELVNRAPSLHDALDVVRHHHERWDGSGYPDRLVREEIPLTARIGAVADVWDALTSDRAYRPAWPADEALPYIVAGQGHLFDPQCVEAFVDLMMARGVSVVQAEVDPEVLTRAAEACHPKGRRAGRPKATSRR